MSPPILENWLLGLLFMFIQLTTLYFYIQHTTLSSLSAQIILNQSNLNLVDTRGKYHC